MGTEEENNENPVNLCSVKIFFSFEIGISLIGHYFNKYFLNFSKIEKILLKDFC